MALWVVKVGGSLYDLPDLKHRLRNWLNGINNPFVHQTHANHVLVVPGGGQLVDEVRHLDARHNLGEEASHWLALRGLVVHAYFLAHLLPGAAVVPWPGPYPLAILDAFSFAERDEGTAGCLPHSWEVTSDALAARVAEVAGAEEVILLKSRAIPLETDWQTASKAGWVDPIFPQIVARANLRVRIVDLRGWLE